MQTRKPTQWVKFVGWVFGDPTDVQVLRNLGVKGRMIWKPSDNSNRFILHPDGKLKQPSVKADDKTGIIEYCEVTMEVARRLMTEYPWFPPGTFTALDKNGNQTIDQPLWHEELR